MTVPNLVRRHPSSVFDKGSRRTQKKSRPEMGGFSLFIRTRSFGKNGFFVGKDSSPLWLPRKTGGEPFPSLMAGEDRWEYIYSSSPKGDAHISGGANAIAIYIYTFRHRQSLLQANISNLPV